MLAVKRSHAWRLIRLALFSQRQVALCSLCALGTYAGHASLMALCTCDCNTCFAWQGSNVRAISDINMIVMQNRYLILIKDRDFTLGVLVLRYYLLDGLTVMWPCKYHQHADKAAINYINKPIAKTIRNCYTLCHSYPYLQVGTCKHDSTNPSIV